MKGRPERYRGIGPRWVEYAVTKLTKNGHLFREIPDYSLQQVTMLLDGIEKDEAATRSATLMDLGVTISGVLGGSTAFAEHLEEIDDSRFEVIDHGERKQH